jgi:hypothetical protein
MSSSRKPTPTGDESSNGIGPESRSTAMFVISPEAKREGVAKTPSADAEGRVRLRDPSMGIREMDESWTLQAGEPPSIALTFSQAVSPAKTSALPESDEDSQATDRDSSSSSPESLSLFDPSGFSSRTFPASSPRTAVGTSESCLERWPTSGMAWHGGFSTAVSSECRSADGECSSSETSLADVLEPSVAERFYLSARAARGILRRAEKRGRELPPALAQALLNLAGGGVSRALTTSNERLDGDTESFVVREREIVSALDTMQGGPDDNSAQAGHLIPE